MIKNFLTAMLATQIFLFGSFSGGCVQAQPQQESQQENNSEVEEPVYQLNVLPHENYDRDSRPCCECCCGDCCCYCDRCNEDCCGECSRCCSTCCRNIDWGKVCIALLIGLAAAGRG